MFVRIVRLLLGFGGGWGCRYLVDAEDGKFSFEDGWGFAEPCCEHETVVGEGGRGHAVFVACWSEYCEDVSADDGAVGFG